MTRYAGRGLTVDFNGVPITQMTSFDPVGSTRGSIDASAYGDEWTSTVVGLQDGNEVNYTIAFDPSETSHQDLVDHYTTTPDDVAILTVAHADASATYYASVVHTAQSVGGALDGLFELTGTFKIVEPGVQETS